MVEVFKTNVASNFQATRLAGVIEFRFDGYKVNFDLDDHDRILRIESDRKVEIDPVITFLKDIGVRAEVLPDEVEDFLNACCGALNNKITLP
jgi:hypothetical protein